MNASLYVLMLSATFAAGCGSFQPTSSAPASAASKADFDSRMCTVYQGSQRRGEDENLLESCSRALGREACGKCLAG
jgi:hypothetical protein